MTSPGYRKTRQLIWASAVAAAVLAALLASAVAWWPLAQSEPVTTTRVPTASKAEPKEQQPLTIASFGDTLSKVLQQPLEEPPPPKPVEVVAVAPPAPVVALPDVQLLGTAQDSQARHSMAWLQLPGQPVVLVALGQTIKGCPGEPVVERIEAGTATLKFGQQELQLRVKKVPLAR